LAHHEIRLLEYREDLLRLAHGQVDLVRQLTHGPGGLRSEHRQHSPDPARRERPGRPAWLVGLVLRQPDTLQVDQSVVADQM
jgi:hypothetical protein